MLGSDAPFPIGDLAPMMVVAAAGLTLVACWIYRSRDAL